MPPPLGEVAQRVSRKRCDGEGYIAFFLTNSRSWAYWSAVSRVICWLRTRRTRAWSIVWPPRAAGGRSPSSTSPPATSRSFRGKNCSSTGCDRHGRTGSHHPRGHRRTALRESPRGARGGSRRRRNRRRPSRRSPPKRSSATRRRRSSSRGCGATTTRSRF